MLEAPNLSGFTVAVITASDRCFGGTQVDVSGPAVAKILAEAGATVVEALVLPDEISDLSSGIRAAAERAQLVLTTGGTGLALRDVTPEATLAVCQRTVPGLAELIRQDGAKHTPFAALGRGVAGVCGGALVINLPGSPKGAVSSLQAVLPLLTHALALLAGETDHAS
jgi:molybdenum cofactor synthesis domain-containing protein